MIQTTRTFACDCNVLVSLTCRRSHTSRLTRAHGGSGHLRVRTTNSVEPSKGIVATAKSTQSHLIPNGNKRVAEARRTELARNRRSARERSESKTRSSRAKSARHHTTTGRAFAPGCEGSCRYQSHVDSMQRFQNVPLFTRASHTCYPCHHQLRPRPFSLRPFSPCSVLLQRSPFRLFKCSDSGSSRARTSI